MDFDLCVQNKKFTYTRGRIYTVGGVLRTNGSPLLSARWIYLSVIRQNNYAHSEMLDTSFFFKFNLIEFNHAKNAVFNIYDIACQYVCVLNL